MVFSPPLEAGCEVSPPSGGEKEGEAEGKQGRMGGGGGREGPREQRERASFSGNGETMQQ